MADIQARLDSLLNLYKMYEGRREKVEIGKADIDRRCVVRVPIALSIRTKASYSSPKYKDTNEQHRGAQSTDMTALQIVYLTNTMQ